MTGNGTGKKLTGEWRRSQLNWQWYNYLGKNWWGENKKSWDAVKHWWPEAIFPIGRNRVSWIRLWGFNQTHRLVNQTKELSPLSKTLELERPWKKWGCFAAPRGWSFFCMKPLVIRSFWYWRGFVAGCLSFRNACNNWCRSRTSALGFQLLSDPLRPVSWFPLWSGSESA